MDKLNIVYLVTDSWDIRRVHNWWLVQWKKTIYRLFNIYASWISYNTSFEKRKTEIYTIDEAKEKAIKIENKRHKERLDNINNL